MGKIREYLGDDAETVLEIVYGPEACWILMTLLGLNREQALVLLKTLKDNA